MATDGPASDSPGTQGIDAARRFVDAGLELLDLDASEEELAVIQGANALYRPLIDALLEAELDGVDPEPGADMSHGPRGLEQR
jgi:hypothetical protein